jgi:hypothetical protein
MEKALNPSTEANDISIVMTTDSSENKMQIPDYSIERFAKFLLPKLREYYESHPDSEQ